ncbi:MAG TPA: Ldh family oxidoreductase [Roseiflexaceae bacterium]|nr:Ldh family oxidoreductase [Roseiflexaceae bacterium]
MPVVAHQSLRRICQGVVEAVGTPADIALAVTESLVEANLAGHDSHGVLRLPWYIGSIQRGTLRAGARPLVAKRDGATAVVDGRLGWGQPAARLAATTAIEIAAESGVGAATIVNGNHIGRVGDYVATIARAGLIGIALCNASPVVAPYGGYRPVMGTNPFAWAAPREQGQPPLVLDFATSIVAEGKLRVARAKGESLPPGLIVDANGAPSHDPEDFYAGGALQTFGLHKGSGMSILIELLARGLAGVDLALPGHRGHNGTLVLALRIGSFAPEAQFFAAAERLCSQISASRPAPGFEAVLLPGEPELHMRERRVAEGIPLAQSTWDEIAALAAELGVNVDSEDQVS